MQSTSEQVKVQWRPIDTAPYDTPVMIRVTGRRAPFEVELRRGYSMTEDEKPCDQWVAMSDRYPRCWSDGCCWDSNAGEQMSAQPTHWRPKP